ncbi:MAG: hypothetical protein A2992_08615, partial [Elusimicrobia bacterium RIFCSPLOWO2_01_FULL_59_12]
MKKFTFILGITFLIETLLMGSAHAVRSSHRPWMARDKGAQDHAQISLRKKSTVTRAKKAPRYSAKGDRIAHQAKRYHGVRYRFGGDSKTKGFDCSGLVRRIYNDLNLKRLPHTSSGLYKMGHSVRLNDLRPGDLVFFKNTYRRGISHVGVYAGRNRFIHAQNRRRGVAMTRLSDPYYQIHYAGARRLY